MGKPPPHIVFKKYVKVIVDRMIPDGLYNPPNYELDVLTEEFQNGAGSFEHRSALKKHEYYSAINKKFEKMVGSQNYVNRVMKYLAPPPRKVLLKGRHKDYHRFSACTDFRLKNIDLD